MSYTEADPALQQQFPDYVRAQLSSEGYRSANAGLSGLLADGLQCMVARGVSVSKAVQVLEDVRARQLQRDRLSFQQLAAHSTRGVLDLIPAAEKVCSLHVSVRMHVGGIVCSLIAMLHAAGLLS